MGFFRKVVLKYIPEFQNLSEKAMEDYLTIFKHKHLVFWFAYTFAISQRPFQIALIVALFDIMLLILSNHFVVFALVFLSIPYLLMIALLKGFTLYQMHFQSKTLIDVSDWLYENLLKLWLLNSRVITHRDWKHIKKYHPKLYAIATTEKSVSQCYDLTHEIANAISNCNIKIVWISVENQYERVGHAILEKNGYVYDTSTKKTYPASQYYKALNAVRYRSFTIKEYSNKNFFEKYWYAFGKWCLQNKVVRGNPRPKTNPD